jgi:hypothetical protein
MMPGNPEQGTVNELAKLPKGTRGRSGKGRRGEKGASAGGAVVAPPEEPTGIDINSDVGRRLVADCVRFYEGLLPEKDVRRKYDFDWERLGADDALIEAIENEKLRRTQNGDTAREKAQKHFVKAPDVLASILDDAGASPRHRIESSRELRVIAGVGPEATPAADRDRFVITINLGPDRVERYEKTLSIKPESKDGGGGEPV